MGASWWRTNSAGAPTLLNFLSEKWMPASPISGLSLDSALMSEPRTTAECVELHEKAIDGAQICATNNGNQYLKGAASPFWTRDFHLPEVPIRNWWQSGARTHVPSKLGLKLVAKRT